MKSLPLLLALPLAACAAKTAPTPVPAEPESAASATVRAALNPAADPCTDFYAYACGGWLENTEIPGDQVRWGRSFSVIREENTDVLRGILDAAAGAGGDGDAARLGAYYGSCTDAEASETRGVEPIQTELKKASAVGDLDQLMTFVAGLHLRGVAPLFDWAVWADFKDPSVQISHWGQGGLGLPDRDYYFPETDDSRSILNDYEANLAKLLIHAGTEVDEAMRQADLIVGFETELARISKRRQDLRDPSKTYHRIEREGLQGLTPNLDWDAFFTAFGTPDLTMINVQVPEYFEALDGLLLGTDPATLQAYLRWHIVLDAAPHLSETFRQTHFDFFRARLAGQKDRRPLWKDCVDRANSALGDALSAEYVAQRFAGESKPMATAMIEGIEQAFEASLPSISWMDPATQERAVGKARAVTNKIGYPDSWRDYSAMELGEHWFENRAAGTRFEIQRQLGTVGEPVDPTEWHMPASAVNAYFNPTSNEIVFPAGILQPPFFSAEFPAAMNYGAIGMVMGHELTHGFDDSGRQFDATGAMVEWWEPEAVTRYEEAASCVQDLYSGYTMGEGLSVNGELTLGENIADLGGIKQSFEAWRAANPGLEATPSGYADLSGSQLYFVAYAQAWCSKATPEIERMLLTVDSHSPPVHRVNGPLSQYPEFATAFSCEAGAPMAPAERCTVW